MGYHVTEIKKGTYGEVSKIQEELDELVDAIEQDNKVMALCELSDIYGAMRGYLEKHHSGFTMKDLQSMADASKRAFEDGDRLPKNSQ